MYFFLTTPNQLMRNRRISPQRCEQLFADFPFHIPALYGWVYTLSAWVWTVVQVSVKFGIMSTCKPKCKSLFRNRKACKHHRTTQCKLANVKPRFFHFIYHAFISIAHSCEISLRQLVATFNRLNKPVWKYVKRSWALHVLFLLFFHIALECVNIPFLFCYR